MTERTQPTRPAGRLALGEPDVRLRPVRRESTVGLIADQLRTAIRTGLLRPGDPLVEGRLAAQLGVSRGPLREATQRLVAEGLLVSSWHRRLTVAVLGPHDVRDVYATREAVEQAAWAAAVRRRTTGSVQRLSEVCARLSDAAHDGDRAAAAEAHLAFHEQVAAESGSHRLRRLLHTLLLESRLAQGTRPSDGPPGARGDVHQAMVDAFSRGDVVSLVRLNSRHMSEAALRLTSTEPPGEGQPVPPDRAVERHR